MPVTSLPSKFPRSLTDTQQDIIHASHQGEITLAGVAGSGKTIVAVARAAELARRTTFRAHAAVLMLCFNRVLATSVRCLLLSFPSDIRDKIEVRNIHKWCQPYIKNSYSAYTVLDNDRDRLRLVREAIAATQYSVGKHEVFERDPHMFLEEIRRIKGCGCVDVTHYVEFQRVRDGELSNIDYEYIYKVADMYDQMLWASKRIDFDDYAHLVLQTRDQTRSPKRYDHVVVDEAQDLSTIQLELVRSLANQSVFVIADRRQAIYESMQLPRTLPPFEDTTYVLRENFRTTVEIFELASCLQQHNEVDVRPLKHGPAPAYRHFRWIEDEAAFVAGAIRQLLDEGVTPGEIAILGRLHHVLAPFTKVLHEASIPVADQDEQQAHEGIALTTIHQAKGREFQAVFLVGLVEGVLPRVMPEMDRAAASQELALAFRLLYVGMTRSKAMLWLTSSEGKPSRLLHDLGFLDHLRG